MWGFMSDYDLIAPFYDIEHASFGEDVDMYRNYAEVCGGKILELACGSGRVLLPLAEDGFALTGVDTSGKMLELAQQRLEEAGVVDRCKLVQQDIANLQLEETFHLAFIALGSFGHISTRSEQQKTLTSIRRQLSRGGMCIIDISNTDARYLEGLSGQMLHQGTWRKEDGSILTHFLSPASSVDRHLLELTHFYDQHRQGENVTRTAVTTYLYLFERSEMELLFEQAGFTVKDVYGDYELSTYQLDSPRMICVAEVK
jgi:ubiquinone/menaquinone biosynthesis C-methylase UbiE